MTDVVDLSEFCPSCGLPWYPHPRMENGVQFCRRIRDARVPATIPVPSAPRSAQRMAAAILAVALVCVILASAWFPGASAAATTGTWQIRTFSGTNETAKFSYPGTVNVTLRPLNLTVSGQRSVTVADTTNASRVYLSTSVGFFPVGSNFTKNATVNVSWAIPSSLRDGGVVTLSVGLSGVKAPEGSVVLTISANISSVVNAILGPIISGFQSQLTFLNGKITGLQSRLDDSNFQHNQIEALMGLAIAILAGYIVYQRRKGTSRKEEEKSDDRELTGYLWDMAVENAEPGDKVAKPPEPPKPGPLVRAEAQVRETVRRDAKEEAAAARKRPKPARAAANGGNKGA